jgi:hypothetical protein
LVFPSFPTTGIQRAFVVCEYYYRRHKRGHGLEESSIMESTIMKQPFYRNLAICSGFALLFLSPVSASAQQVQRNPIVVHAAKHATTPRAFRAMTPVPWHNTSKVMPRPGRAPHPHISDVPDASIQNEAQSEVLPQVRTTSLLNFDGITAAQGGGFVPPDTNASVGATQVVETVNVAYAVYNKTTGAQIMAPTNIQTLYAPLGGECGTGDLTDPVATYDKAAGRWLITMIASNRPFFTVNELCVAVSTSSDATGTFNLYSFSFGATLPDYPKLGVWPDAYYVTANNFPGGGSFVGALTCALDRAKMLAGSAATIICFQRGISDFSLLPADLDGATPPPPGAPNYQLELGSSTTLNLFKFHVDFAVPANSTFTGPTAISVPAFTDACFGGTCIPQPAPGERLDSLGDRLMHRLAYRNFGTHEALVANHSIKAVGIGHAASAVRWYEIRSPGSVPVVFQRGRVGGGAITVSRWMGSIAMDKNGDIALGFSRSSSAVKPAITYVGRIPSDPLNKMESPKVIVLGNGVQKNSFHRWGDYSSMAIDPSDDCTFWYAQEYYKTPGASAFNWVTRLASFKFPGCSGVISGESRP